MGSARFTPTMGPCPSAHTASAASFSSRRLAARAARSAACDAYSPATITHGRSAAIAYLASKSIPTAALLAGPMRSR